MKRFVLLFSIVFAAPVFADESFFGTERASALLNSPSVSGDVAKAGVGMVQPGIEELYDIRKGEWRTGVSASLYTFKSKDVPIVQIRSGYVADYMPYVSGPIDLHGVTTRYVVPILPDKAKAWLTAGPLDLAWTAAGKYGVVGPWAGYNLDKEEDGNDEEGGLAFGVSVGAKFTF